MKFCKYCHQEKPLDAFSLNKNAKDGRQNRCKQCFCVYMKNRIAEKSGEINAKRRIQYAEQIEKKRAQTRVSYEKHKEKRLAYVKEYNSRLENKIRRREIMKAWKKRKYESDHLFALKYRISSLFRMALKVRGYGKTTQVAKILGCTWEELATHIERQFLPGMTWLNRGEWHIDHIIPLAVAKSEDDVVKLNHYTNLRPLWAKDNLLKSDKLETLL
jgi:hypothetical protein